MKENPFLLQGKIVLVTGGGTGLGFEIARCFSKAGARVGITGRRKEVLESAASQMGDEVIPMSCDLNHLDSIPEFVDLVESELGPIDILVNNAGIHLKKMAVDITDAEFQSVIQTHLMASFTLSRETAKRMIPRKQGHILFMGSMASLFGIPQVSAYTAAKTAIVGLTKSLATEWSRDGIRVNAIAPGWIAAGMARKILDQDPERKTKILTRTPLGQLGESEDIGWAAVYLSSPAAKFITGHTLVVDGGVSIGF